MGYHFASSFRGAGVLTGLGGDTESLARVILGISLLLAALVPLRAPPVRSIDRLLRLARCLDLHDAFATATIAATLHSPLVFGCIVARSHSADIALGHGRTPQLTLLAPSHPIHASLCNRALLRKPIMGARPPGSAQLVVEHSS
jgi:hypothetical protein